MGEIEGYIRKYVWVQIAAFVGLVLLLAGGINDVVGFLSAPWLPKWGPAAFGALLFYVAFQMMAFQVHRAIRALELSMKALPIQPSPEVLNLPGPVEKRKLRPCEASRKSYWSPDISFGDALNHLRYKSTWRPSYNSFQGDAEAIRALQDALYSSKVTAWAREHPDTEEFQLSPTVWGHGVEIRPRDDWAFTAKFNTTLHGIRLSEAEVLSAWPAR